METLTFLTSTRCALLHIIIVLKILLRAHFIIEQRRRTRRRWWVRPVNRSRKQLGFFKTCLTQLRFRDEEHFFKAVRMDEVRYGLLANLVHNRLSRRSIRRPIPPDMRLAVTLMYLAHGSSFQFLAWSFKLGVSTVRKVIYETCEAIWEELHTIYLAPPSIHEWELISQKFYTNTGMPHCLGAVDGKLINIVCPRGSGSLYYSYKKSFAIVLLAACDMDYTFTLVDVGALGSQSDGGVFVRSTFGKMVLENTLPVPAAKNLPGTDVLFPYYFVGDNAFPLRKNLMRPFPGNYLPADKANFNKNLSKARVRIEIAFGILANRWRILQSKISSSPKNADKIVLATIALHNFLMLQKSGNYYTPRDEGRFDEVGLRSAKHSLPNRSSQTAFQYRDTLKDYLQRDLGEN